MPTTRSRYSIFSFLCTAKGRPVLLALAVAVAFSASGGPHAEKVQHVLMNLVIVLLFAKIGGDLAVRAKQPEVLGELIIGVVLGNIALVGISFFDVLESDPILPILSELGVILLLFEVGLESSISEMMRVGLSSFLVAVLGVVAPFALGWFVSSIFAPDAHALVHVFVGATLTATSVGITARVLKELGKVKTNEGKIILGAAVIDDILGLLVLAIVTGIIASVDKGAETSIMSYLNIVLMAVLFFAGALLFGRYISPLLFRIATHLQSHGILLAMSLSICFGLSYLAAVAGLATIVGAFTAGLILEPVHYKNLRTQTDEEIDHLIAPITGMLVPVFFVTMGAQVKLTEMADPGIIGFAFWLTLVAIIGKQLCSLGVLGKGNDKIAVGLGMIPRGEVGLIFADIGKKLSIAGKPVVDAATFGAVIVMVIVTTMVTPPAVKWRFSSGGHRSGSDDDDEDPTAEHSLEQQASA